MKITHKEKFKTGLKEYHLACISVNDVPYCDYHDSEEELFKILEHRKA